MSNYLELKYASSNDCELLTIFNKELIDDGGCNNSMNINQLRERMNEFIESDEYDVILFEHNNCYIGYTLINIKKSPKFIRHFFIDRKFRRRGYGRYAFEKIVELYDTKKFDLTVLKTNTIGYMFWKSCGLFPYEIYMQYRKD